MIPIRRSDVETSDERYGTRRETHNAMVSQLHQHMDSGAPQARLWQGMNSASSSVHDAQALQTMTSTTATQKLIVDKLP